MKASRVIEYARPFYFPSEGYIRLIGFTIPGNLQRKDNQRRIVKVRGKPLVIKSKSALAYARSFMEQVPECARQAYGDTDHPLALWAHAHYQSNRSDLSVELLKDLLEKAGVVSNDRWIKAELLFASIDRDNPRVEIEIYAII